MRQLSENCALLTTTEADERIAGLILAEDNSMGAMGSGGYVIRQEDEFPGGAIHLSFEACDCAPVHGEHVFIKDGMIWVTSMRGWVMALLSYEGIKFTCEQVATPSFILEHLQTMNQKHAA